MLFEKDDLALFLHSSGGSKGGPPTDQNFFNFIGFSENIIKILGRRPPSP